MEILLFILALLFGMGAIGDKEQGNRNNYTKNMYCVHYWNYFNESFIRKVR